MADKSVGELIAAQSVTPTDLFVLEQNGTAKKLTGQTLENWLVSFADGHGGIQNIEKVKTSGLVDTYRITLADTTTFDFMVTNGRGISSLRKTATSGLVDTYTFTYNDGTTGTFTVTNGAKGDKGDTAYIWVKYASQEPTAASHSFGDVPDAWMGVYFGFSATAPTDWQQYKWYNIKGQQGDTGAPATLVSASVTYQVGDSGTVVPSGIWNSSIPAVAQGKYLWTQIVQTFNTGNPITAYTVSRMGVDGLGSVVSVNNQSPDADGNVNIDASALGALPKLGGTMEGSINMNGQKITGLNSPTADDEPATKKYADNLKPNLTGYATETYVNSAVKKAAPRNLSDNSDFTQFVAQAGIGQKHEPNGPTYAGDRWILESGTVTGEKRDDGNGYTNITLNGTILQKVANAPDVGTAAIEMVSGMADISYENGEITITSNGGTIKNVRLFKGAYSNDSCPAHQPKGYGAELAECQRYYLWIVEGTSNLHLLMAIGGSNLYGILNTPVTMRINPTPVFTGLYARKTSNVTSITDIDRCVTRNEGVLVSMKAGEGILEAGTVYQIRCENGLLAFAADL